MSTSDGQITATVTALLTAALTRASTVVETAYRNSARNAAGNEAAFEAHVEDQPQQFQNTMLQAPDPSAMIDQVSQDSHADKFSVTGLAYLAEFKSITLQDVEASALNGSQPDIGEHKRSWLKGVAWLAQAKHKVVFGSCAAEISEVFAHHVSLASSKRHTDWNTSFVKYVGLFREAAESMKQISDPTSHAEWRTRAAHWEEIQLLT